jgi:biopolymer transport protein ExbD
MNFRKRLNIPQSSFQMAPMIDIMFLLLIFFMVAAVYAQWEKKIGIDVPTAQSFDDNPRIPGEIIINIEDDGVIYVNNTQMSIARLENLLANVAQDYRDQPIIIRADGTTDHQDVMAVLDVCRTAGIWNVAFAVLPKAQNQP